MTHPQLVLALILTLGARGAAAQAPSRVDYTLRVDSADLSGITVDMRIVGAPAEFRVAMVAHTEYDDEYWRYLTELRGESSRGAVRIAREDSSLWRVSGAAGDVTLHYRIRFPASPPMQQASWKAHLVPNGGLVGGPHSFLYVPGGEHWPVSVRIQLPHAWTIVTGLRSVVSAGDSYAFAASGIEALVDSPMLVGLIRSWRFDVKGIPHDIAFLGRPAGTPFDTALFVSNVERIARETVGMFKRMPYREYQFLFEDGASGGLEHVNSVSIGTQSSNFARNPNSYLEQIAHEFFHTWNEVHLRPVSWIGVRHVAPTPTGELWWSEGVTLGFADLLLRRAGLYTPDSTRVAHLERYIANYHANPSHGMVSPEATSRAFNMPAETTGDFTPSMFTQGELIGAMLDLMIRDASSGRRSLDDVMRTLSSRFTLDRGFTGADVEGAVGEVCACDVKPFFAQYVRAAGALDFDKWLGLVGQRTAVSWAPARAADGVAAPDIRVSANSAAGDSLLHLKIWFPGTLWGRAGLHSGDRLAALNGVAMRDASQFRTALGQMHVGDSVHVSVLRDGLRLEKTIVVAGYEGPTVRIEPRTDATAAQRALFAQWSAGH
jgi:predicted metalloprotease with PDZ domain